MKTKGLFAISPEYVTRELDSIVERADKQLG